MMESESIVKRVRGVDRRWRVWLGALWIGLACGCATTTVVDGDATEVVSRGRAQRDLGMDYLSTVRTAMAIR